MRKHLSLLCFLLCLSLFLFTRFYKLPETLYFWGDIGRDHEMLMEMVQNKRPILLGPSNSELPFNQSAWYYYLNLPVFIISGYSAFTTAITGALLTLSAFIYSAWKSKSFQKTSLLILLFTAQPIFLAQQRSTWNPAFALPFLIVAFTYIGEILSTRKVRSLELWILSFALSFSVAMTFAVVPLVLAVTIVAMIFLKKNQKIHFLLTLTAAFLIAFLPHLLFEVRHHFLLSKQLLQSTANTKAWLPFTTKLSTGIFSIFGFLEANTQLPKKIAITFLLMLWGINVHPQKEKRNTIIILIAGLISFLISTTLVTQFHSHYSLVFSALIIFVISGLPRWWGRGITALLILLWLPLMQTPFIQKPHRTVAQLDSCAQKFCADNKQPIYVTAQAWHDFHNGYDYSFFMNKNGCYTRDIGTNPGFSNELAVVVDRSNFDPSTTSFYELSLFGEKELVQTYECKEDLSIHLFKKNKSP